MRIESVTLENFQAFGPNPVTFTVEPDLTALIGTNGTGKTAACRALQRMFGVSSDERAIRAEDFHVADGAEDSEARALRIEVILAFPELDTDAEPIGVPDFFRRMAAEEDGELKCRLALESTWTADGTVDGAIETKFRVISVLRGEYSDEQAQPLGASERSRVQVVYVPAARDGARQVSTFLRSRLWNAARWSQQLTERVTTAAGELDAIFHAEAPVRAIEDVLTLRWAALHGGGPHAKPRFQPLAPELEQFLRNTELTFSPDHTAASRSAKSLSDGQKSLLHLSLVAATLELESMVLDPAASTLPFDTDAAYLPALTVLLVEEPENSLAPFYLSRIVRELLQLGATPRAQVILSSHSAAALTRVDPGNVRHFRNVNGEATVRVLTLPDDGDEAATYVREAVQAHPELYFARYVILGEGASEEIVLPIIARHRGVDLDPAFVAMVPLGGRHTHHFWRLLHDLGVPHATLLDLDLGRAGGGAGRIRTAVTNLIAVGTNPLDGLENFETVADIGDDINSNIPELKTLIARLRDFAVYFSSPLDLDFALLQHFPAAYKVLESGQRGPEDSDPYEAVLGAGRPDNTDHLWIPEDETLRREKRDNLRWYRYLFSNRSKPGTHIKALGRLAPADFDDVPVAFSALIERVRQAVEDQ